MSKPLNDDFDEDALFAATAASRKAVGALAPTGNPLLNFYRSPGLHVCLPTRGAFMPPGTLEQTMAKDIPVLPMRAMDEIMLKSPDALMSGYAIEKLLESCVPALKAPKLVSLPDLDVFLLAIRAATNGENMLLTASCPKCGTDNEFTCHLPALLATMTMVDPENPVRLSDEVVIYLRPYNLYNATSVALASYEEARRLQTFENENGTEDPRRKTEINRTIERLAKLNLEMLADCIIKVVVPGAEVTDAAQIGGFLFNTKKSWINKIEKKLNQINDKGIDKTIHAKCQNVECNHEWKTQVEFDPASFFDDNSSE